MIAARGVMLAVALSGAFGFVSPAPARADHKTIGLLAVPELMPGDSCEPFPPATVALYAARTALTRVRAEQLVQRINLYLALGGGFDLRAPAQAGTPPSGG